MCQGLHLHNLNMIKSLIISCGFAQVSNTLTHSQTWSPRVTFPSLTSLLVNGCCHLLEGVTCSSVYPPHQGHDLSLRLSALLASPQVTFFSLPSAQLLLLTWSFANPDVFPWPCCFLFTISPSVGFYLLGGCEEVIIDNAAEMLSIYPYRFTSFIHISVINTRCCYCFRQRGTRMRTRVWCGEIEPKPI